MNIYQIVPKENTETGYILDVESRVQERQQVKGKQSYILVSVAYLTYLSNS